MVLDVSTALHPSPARLVIADDHDLARSGLRAMLEGEADLEVVGEALDGLDALALCRAKQPDVALLDLRMPRLDGLAAAREIRLASPATRILMVTMHDSLEHMGEAIKAGASGYVLKDASRQELLAAVRSVLRGGSFLSSALTARLLQERTGGTREPGSAVPALTTREAQVLGLIVQGQSNKEIARSLSIAPGTAKIHVERLIAKLGVADRTQAAVKAIDLDLVPRPRP